MPWRLLIKLYSWIPLLIFARYLLASKFGVSAAIGKGFLTKSPEILGSQAGRAGREEVMYNMIRSLQSALCESGKISVLLSHTYIFAAFGISHFGAKYSLALLSESATAPAALADCCE